MVGCSVAACTYNTNNQVPDDTALTDKIKLLEIHAMSVHQSYTDAVTAFHPSLYAVNLHNAQQLQDESTRAFAGRVHNISRKCSLQKRCQCGIQVSFRKETVYHVVLAGLQDKELQKACTNGASLNNIRDITTLVDFCTTKESNQPYSLISPETRLCTPSNNDIKMVLLNTQEEKANNPLHSSFGLKRKRRKKNEIEIGAGGLKCEHCMDTLSRKQTLKSHIQRFHSQSESCIHDMPEKVTLQKFPILSTSNDTGPSFSDVNETNPNSKNEKENRSLYCNQNNTLPACSNQNVGGLSYGNDTGLTYSTQNDAGPSHNNQKNIGPTSVNQKDSDPYYSNQNNNTGQTCSYKNEADPFYVTQNDIVQTSITQKDAGPSFDYQIDTGPTCGNQKDVGPFYGNESVILQVPLQSSSATDSIDMQICDMMGRQKCGIWQSIEEKQELLNINYEEMIKDIGANLVD